MPTVKSVQFGNGQVRYFSKIDPQPATSETTGNVTVNTAAIPGQPARYKVSFMLSFAADEDGLENHNVFHLTCLVPDENDWTPYRSIEDRAARQLVSNASILSRQDRIWSSAVCRSARSAKGDRRFMIVRRASGSCATGASRRNVSFFSASASRRGAGGIASILAAMRLASARSSFGGLGMTSQSENGVPWLDIHSDRLSISPEFAAEVASILIEWSRFENGISFDTHQFMRYPILQPLANTAPISFKKKIELWKKCVCTLFSTVSIYREQADNICSDGKTISKRRNLIIHGLWNNTGEDKYDVLLIRALHNVENIETASVDLNYLTKLRQDIAQVTDAFFQLPN